MILSLLFALPILADIPVSAPVLRPATGVQWAPALATNGSDAMAAWQDERGMLQQNFFAQEIYAARIGTDGTPSAEVDVHPSAEKDRAPAVVWNGEQYVIAHLVQSPDFAFEGIQFTGGAASRLMPASEFASGLPLHDVGPLALAWNGREYLAVMNAYTLSNYALYGVLVDRSFHPIGSAFPIASGFVALGSVASDGDGFFVTWLGDRSVNSANVSPSGSVAVHPPLNDPATATYFTYRPAVVWNGQRYLVTWSDPVLHARFVERDGTPSSPAVDLSPAGGGTGVAWNGREYLLAFTEGDQPGVFALRLDGEGKALDAEPFAITSIKASFGGPAVVAVGNRFLVAWADEESTAYSFVNGTTPSPRTILAHSLGAQGFARGLFDAANYAFTWLEEGNAYFGRVAPDGRPLDGSGVVLGPAYQSLLAFNGRHFAVAFNQHVLRIDRDGTIADDIQVGNPIAAVTTDGRDFLLLTDRYPELRPVLLTQEGVLLAQPVIENNPYGSLAAAAAWNGSHYVVVYLQPTEAACYKCGQRYEVRTVLLDRGGRVASPVRTIVAGRLPIFPLPAVQVASGNGASVAVFSDGFNAWSAAIDEQGLPGAAAKLPDAFMPRDLIWSGSYFLAAGQDGLRIAPSGVPLGTFTLGPLGAQSTTFVHGAPRLTFLYDRPVPSGGQGSIERVFFDFVQEARRRAR